MAIFPVDPVSFAWGAAIGILGAFGTGLFKKAGEDFYAWVKNKVHPKPTQVAGLILEPINGQGSNIRSEDSRGFFYVQVRFKLKATAEADILNLDLNYCNSSYRTTEEEILVDGQDIGTDRHGRLRTSVHLNQGHTRCVTLISRFPKEPHVADYGDVSITAEVGFLTHREFQRKEWRFQLASGGILRPIAP